MESPAVPPTASDVASTFRAVMRSYAATVTIVTASDGGRRHGITATSVTSLSLDPPSLLVCVNRKTLLHDILLSARRLCVNVLSREQSALSAAFSGALAPEARFAVGTWDRSPDGIDFLRDAQARLFCRKVAMLPFGTHAIVIGEVDEVGLGDTAEPLLYCDATYCISVPARA
jgi:flavin reductase (DIM6/NTAB) family NADH-FMN oxidoreductase RutF